MVLLLFLRLVFALVERKNQTQLGNDALRYNQTQLENDALRYQDTGYAISLLFFYFAVRAK
jgi:hypothetical protein